MVVLAVVVVLLSASQPIFPGPFGQASISRQSSGILAVPVLPVGGLLARGRETLAGAVAEVDAAAASGASGIRLTADMQWLCPTRTCDTAPLDPVIARAATIGLQVYLHVNSTPVWLEPRGRWFPPLGEKAEAWAVLFGQLVARYGTAVTAYEVWNEPNAPEFWRTGSDAGAYADLLKAVWSEVQQINPRVALVGAVLSNNDLGYMQQLSQALRERGGNLENGFFYDLLGVHPYAGAYGVGYDPEKPAGSADEETATGTKDMTFLGVDRLRAQVARQEGIWRNVVIGEFGYDTTPGAWYHVPEPRRAQYLVTAVDLASRRNYIQSLSIYSYSDEPDDGFSILGTPSRAAVEAAG
jgi:hypothetical protein